MSYHKTGEDRVCRVCQTKFYVPGWQLKNPRYRGGTYCSRECKHKGQTGVETRRGTKYVTEYGYVMIKTGIRKWTFEHRLIVEAALGRKLTDDEQVHHINGDKQDNRIENLRVLTNSEHQQLHGAGRWLPTLEQRWPVIKCAECGKDFRAKACRLRSADPKSHTKYCSLACRHKGWRKQMTELKRRK